MSDGQGSVTTAEAALLVHVAKSTIRTWVSRGLLEPTGRWRGSNVFLVAAVWRAEELAFRRDTSGNAGNRQ